MKYYVSGRKQNPGSKDIGAFYGLNRTGKINDFQLSDMLNLDCEFFPYVGTRRARELVSGDWNMKVIASDSDVGTAEYAVTGVTADGDFIYRGEVMGKIPSMEEGHPMSLLGGPDGDITGTPDFNLQGGAASAGGDMYLAEYNGEYVLFPSLDVISVSDGNMEVSSFKSTGDDYETDMRDLSPGIYENAGTVYCNAEGMGSITIRKGNTRQSLCREIAMEFVSMIAEGKLSVGKNIVLSMYKHDIRDYYARIPKDVYESITSIYIQPVDDPDRYLYQEGLEDVDAICSNMEDIFDSERIADVFGRDNVAFEITICFDAYDGTDSKVDISAYFEEAWDPRGETERIVDYFQIGSLSTSYPYDMPIYSNLKISFVENVMLMGEPYGGRLFTVDNQGVTVYYSSAAEKYDFKQEAVSGGAGFLLCSDPGKWTGMQVYHDSLYVFKRDSMYRITSSDGLTFYMDKIADIGAVSPNGVCIEDDIMYFLSSDGIYQFTGSYPLKLPDSLGRQYDGGTLGGCDGKVFCSLRYRDESKNEQCELIVWHPDKNIYSRHDSFDAVQFLYAYGRVYALDSCGKVYLMEGERKPTAFCFETKEYFFGFVQKAVNAVRVYFAYEPYTYTDEETGEIVKVGLQIEASYDGGEWEKCHKPITDGRVRYVPIKFKKCDEFQLRISGKGVFDLKALSFHVYQGGDVRQNHMKYMKF